MKSIELKEKAKSFGSDLTGVASVERFKSLSPERSPLSIFPECKSVIVLGRRILRGALRGIEEGTNFGSTYGHFGYCWLEDNFLSQTTYDVTCWLEENGFEAVPLFGYNSEGMPDGIPVAEGKPAPNVIVDYEFAAHAAGLAEMGLGGFLLSDEFGHRQRFAMILTDAELEPDEPKRKTVCGDCGVCVMACPFGAIDAKKTRKFGVAGCEMDVATIDYSICRQCHNGASCAAAGRGNRPDRLAAICARTCLVQLEKNGKLGNKFENDFRKRKPWVLDSFKRRMEGGTVGNPAELVGCGKNPLK